MGYGGQPNWDDGYSNDPTWGPGDWASDAFEYIGETVVGGDD